MLYFRLTLSKFERKSFFKALSQAQKSGQLTVVNRIRAILAIAEGKDIDDIAAILRVSKEAIRQWLKKYLAEGLKALRIVRKSSGGYPGKLTKTQKRQLIKWVTDGPQIVGFGVCQASCRLFFSNEVPSSTAQFSHGLRRAIGGPFSAMRELCYTVPYSNGYTACLSAVFSIFCRLNFFKVTIVPGSQFLVLPDHLSGCFDLAF